MPKKLEVIKDDVPASQAQSAKKQATKKPKSSAYYQRQYRQRLREQGLVKKEVWILPEHNQLLLSIEKVLREHHDNMLNKIASLPLFGSQVINYETQNQLPISEINKGINNENVTLIENTIKATQENNSQKLAMTIESTPIQTLEGEKMHTSLSVVNSINKHLPQIVDEHPNLKNIQWTTQSLFDTLKKAPLFVNGLASIEIIEGVHATIYICMHEFGDLPLFLNVTGEQILAESLLFSVEEIRDRNKFNELVLRTHKYFPLSNISLDKIGDDGEYYQMFGSLSSTSSLQEVIIEIELLAHNVMQATEAYSAFFIGEGLAS